MSDLISAQESVAEIVDTAIRKILSGEQKLTKDYEQSVKEAVNAILDTARREAQADTVRCKDCVHADNFYHCDYMTTWHDGECFCSFAERRADV